MIAPTPSGKRSKAFKARRLEAKRARQRARGGYTIQQSAVFAIRKLKHKKGSTFNQIRGVIRKSGIMVSNFVLKKVMQRLVMLKVVSLKKWHYSLTGKHCPSRTYGKKRTSEVEGIRKDVRSKMNRRAGLQCRHGRTCVRVVFRGLKTAPKKKMFNQVKAQFTHGKMFISNFILLKVLQEMRRKKVVKLIKGRNKLTGKPCPRRKKRNVPYM